MSTFKERIQKILTEALDQPPAIHQHHQQEFSAGFINYIKHAENGIRSGFDKKTGLWKPHRSVEGGSDTIAYGHKIKPGEHFDKGITEDKAIELLNRDLHIAREHAKMEVTKKYGPGIFENLSLLQQEMLTDFVFNLGSLQSFPKFTRGVLLNDKNIIEKEYRRFTGGRELTSRNQMFRNRYLS